MIEPTSHAACAHGTPVRATAIWLFLVGVTVFGWLAAEQGAAGPAIAALLFSAAFAKGTFVILDFMALRRAPLLWPLVTLGWLALVCALIGLAYWKGIQA